MNKAVVAHFVPRWLGNPYHSELAKHLATHGVAVKDEDCLKVIFQQIRSHKRLPDIIHLHVLPEFRTSPVAIARYLLYWWRVTKLRRLGVKIVWTVHNLAPHEARHPSIDAVFSRRLFGKADAVIIHSVAAKRTIEQQWGVQRRDNIHIIPHGNYIASYPNNISRQAAREQLELPLHEMVFLFLGLIRVYKGVPALIETFRRLPYDDLHLLIAGEPVSKELWRDIQQKAEDCSQVQLHPSFISPDKIQIYMNAADIVVFPYTKTLTTGALLLAMSFGRACIAPKMGTIQDTLDDQGGFLYDPAAPNGLRDSMELAVRCRGRLEDMGKYNRRRAESWDWDDIAAKTTHAYRQCLGAESVCGSLFEESSAIHRRS